MMHTEGETEDTASEIDPTGADPKWTTKSYRDEARDMKRQLRHYVNESNMNGIQGLDKLLNISPSDLESGAETQDPDTIDQTATNLLFPVSKRKNAAPIETADEAVTVREKLDSMNQNVNDMIEILIHEQKKIKDKKALALLATLQEQLSGLQDNVEDAESELKAEEKKYHSMSKEYEKASKKYQALKDRQDREEREKQDRLIKEQQRKLKENEVHIARLMAMQGTPMGATPGSYAGSVMGGSVMGGSVMNQPIQQGAMSPRLETIQQAPSVFSDDTVQINQAGIDQDYNDPQMMPVSAAINSHPNSPNRGRDRNRHGRGSQSKSLSRKSNHNRFTSNSHDSNNIGRMNEVPHISDIPDDEDDLFGGNKNNGNVDTGHRSSNDLDEAPIMRQSSNHSHTHQSHHSHHSGSHHSNPNRFNIAPQPNPMPPFSVSSGNSIPNNNNINNNNNNNNNNYMDPNGSNANSSHGGRYGQYASPQPGEYGYDVNGYPMVRYPDSMGMDSSQQRYNQQQQQQQSTNRPLFSDTGIKIVAGCVVFAGFVWIISKLLDNGGSNTAGSIVRRPPRGRGF